MAFRPPTYDDIVNSKYATALPAPAVLPQTEIRPNSWKVSSSS